MTTAKKLQEQADKCAARAKELRKQAAAAKRAEAREAKRKATEQLRREELAALKYARTISHSADTTLYDYVMNAYRSRPTG